MYVDSITEPLSFLMLKHVVLFYDQRKKKGDKRRETAAFFRAALLEILMTGLTDLLPPLFQMQCGSSASLSSSYSSSVRSSLCPTNHRSSPHRDKITKLKKILQGETKILFYILENMIPSMLILTIVIDSFIIHLIMATHVINNCRQIDQFSSLLY